MKRLTLRSLAVPLLALALGGCSTYGYVDGGGGYYTGAPVTQYRYTDGYGYPAYGYPSSGYGYSPYGYWSPGMSFGLGYGYSYGGYPRYYSPYRGGYYYPGAYYGRPPVHRPPPRPGGHDHEPGTRPPTAGNDGRPRPPNRAPWRDLDRLRDGADPNRGPSHDARPGVLGTRIPIHGGAPATSAMPRPAVAPSAYERGRRFNGGNYGGSYAPPPRSAPTAEAPQRFQGGGMSAPRPASVQPRMERPQPRPAPRMSEPTRTDPARSVRRDTIEP